MGSELHRCRFCFSFAPRVRGRSGLGRPRGLRPETPPPATRQGRLPVGSLAVRTKPRQRHPTASRPLGPRGLRSHGRSHPRGGLNAHPRSSAPTHTADPASDFVAAGAFWSVLFN